MAQEPRSGEKPAVIDTEDQRLVSTNWRYFLAPDSCGISSGAGYHRSVKQKAGLGCACAVAVLLVSCAGAQTVATSSASSDTTVGRLITEIRLHSKKLENSSGMRSGFASFTSAYKIDPRDISYSDYVIVRLVYEATRDAGFWNMHWTITDMPPNSDRIWKQWKDVKAISPAAWSAYAECDELSALFSFLVDRAGVRTVGLFWPYPNHTVAVWVVHPRNGKDVRVVVPTSQIFLDVQDSFGTRKFNPWHQKTIFEYKRRDVPDSFTLPKPVFEYFVRQVDRYAGASDSALQQIRYLREGVFLKYWTADAAAQDALSRKKDLASGPAEDVAAFQNFADDMRQSSSP